MQTALCLQETKVDGCQHINFKVCQPLGTHTRLPAKVHTALLIDTPAVDKTDNSNSMTKPASMQQQDDKP